MREFIEKKLKESPRVVEREIWNSWCLDEYEKTSSWNVGGREYCLACESGKLLSYTLLSKHNLSFDYTGGKGKYIINYCSMIFVHALKPALKEKGIRCCTIPNLISKGSCVKIAWNFP